MTPTSLPASGGRPFHHVAFAASVTLLLALLVVWAGWRSTSRRLVQEPSAFAAAVDLAAIENIAVHPDGRTKSFGSSANTLMDLITGPHKFEGQSAAFTYLDLIFRPERYDDVPLCFVKHKDLREEIIAVVRTSPLAAPGGARALSDLEARFAFLRKWGLVSPRILGEPQVEARLSTLSGDVIRWSKHVNQARDAFGVRNADLLVRQLRVIPPHAGGEFDAWGTFTDLRDARGEFARDMPVEMVAGLLSAWGNLREAWEAEDAEGVRAASVALAEGLAAVNPAIYPPRDRLAWESWYFRHDSLTRVWIIYLVSFVLLLLALVYGWRGARTAGIWVFFLAFLLQTASVGLRWWISDRWPNSNMFEAVTTSAWFGAVAALLFWIFGRGALMRHLCLLTSAAASMVALMCAHFMPLHLNPNISNMMPVLHDVWLYIHTNVIIASYILIFMAAVSSALYLLWRACGGAPSSVSLAGTSLMANLARGELKAVAAGVLPAAKLTGSDAAAVEAASDELTAAARGHLDLGVIFDGVTMLLMKVSFVMLWAGIVMGAIWADHSWGRPWGWDPKEVFALNTFLVFALLVHVRLKARDKGFWTAWLAMLGAGVMLFNWIVINFLITGLHSYA